MLPLLNAHYLQRDSSTESLSDTALSSGWSGCSSNRSLPCSDVRNPGVIFVFEVQTAFIPQVSRFPLKMDSCESSIPLRITSSLS